jgi:DNA-binding transcriptional MerR regulator
MRVRQLANEGLLKPIVTADGWRLFARGDVERLAADRRAQAHAAKPIGATR